MTTRRTDSSTPLGGPTGQVVAAHRGELREVLGRHGVVRARVFGSVARGDDDTGSDVDILVDLPPGTSLFDLLRLQDELELILGVKVDLVPESALKTVFREPVEADAVPL